MAAMLAMPQVTGLRAVAPRAAPVARTAARPAAVAMAAPRASLAADSVKQVGKALAAAAASLVIASAASAATVKMGGDQGELVFEPATLKVSAGESIVFKNNKAFPHNVMFDEDAVPGGVSVDAISHEDYFNGPGDSYTVTLTKPGTYEYYCEPHQGAGMGGKITVS